MALGIKGTKAMSAETNELLDAHEAMVAVLDAKWANVPEWKAFRAIDRALLASITKAPSAPAPVPQRVQIPRRRLRINDDAPIPYMTLADKALAATGKPITTSALMEYIIARRTVGNDPKKARIVVQSSLSKDERFRSIPWESGRAWWYADRPVPKKETAG
jgi:hypothetical protein